MLIARYVSPAEADRKQQRHKLIRGAVPFNIEAQRWLNPIGGGDRIGWFLGKVVVLHFWATWSPESVEQLAHYDELYKKHKDDGPSCHRHPQRRRSRRSGRLRRRTRLYSCPLQWTKVRAHSATAVWNFPQSVLLDRDCRIAWLSEEGETPSQAQLNYLLDDSDKFPTH